MSRETAAGLRHTQQDIGTDRSCSMQLLVHQSVRAGDLGP